MGLPHGADYQAQLQPVNISLLNRGIDQCIAAAVAAQDWQKLKLIPETYMPWARFLGLDSEANNLTLAKIRMPS